ncbi:hypothetical protein [Roseovarius sp. D22-M7]|uniref:hypothetical protein n=1 Tax=Roseovarius sp. D22-M7 TaxID=3127116 RepID=UPI00300F7C89
MSTPNLAIAHIQASQDQKEVTANAAFDALDLAMTDSGILDVGAGGIIPVPSAQALGLVRLVLTGAPGAGVTVAFPAVKRLVIVCNEADAVAIITRAGGPGETTVEPGDQRILYLSGGGVQPAAREIYDFGAVSMATPGPGEVIGKVVIPRDVRLPADLAGAAGHVDVPPDAAWSVDVTVDGLTVGTINVSTTGLVTFTTTSPDPVTIDAGSVVRFVASSFAAPAEASVAGLAVTLRGAVI